MKFAEINPSAVELAAGRLFYRVQLQRAIHGSVKLGDVLLPPTGLLSGRFCLQDEPVAYFADSDQTALYESLLRRETQAQSIANLRKRCLTTFVSQSSLRLVDLRDLAEPYPVLHSLRFQQTQALSRECRAKGFNGILYSSAQHPGHTCAALFRTGIENLATLTAQPLVKKQTNRLLKVVQTALWRSGVPLAD